MRFLIAFLLLYVVHVQSAKTAENGDRLPPEKVVKIVSSHFIAKRNLPFKTRTIFDRDELTPLHLIQHQQQHLYHFVYECAGYLSKVRSSGEKELARISKFSINFSNQLILKVLYPKHTFW